MREREQPTLVMPRFERVIQPQQFTTQLRLDWRIKSASDERYSLLAP